MSIYDPCPLCTASSAGVACCPIHSREVAAVVPDNTPLQHRTFLRLADPETQPATSAAGPSYARAECMASDLRRLSDLVAEHVMGWTLPPDPGDLRAWMRLWTEASTPELRQHRIWTGYWQCEPWNCVSADRWAPAERWDHAGLVLDRMRELGFVWRLDLFGSHLVDCVIEHDSDSRRGYSYDSPTPQQAICRAALRAMGVEV